MRRVASIRGGAVARERRGAHDDGSRLTEHSAIYVGRGLVAIAALVGGLFVSSPALGDGPPASAAVERRGAHVQKGVSDVDRAFDAGVELYAAEKYKEAEEVFRSVWKARRTYDVAANLGHAELRLNKVPEAAEHLSFALRNWPLIGEEDFRSLAASRLAEAKARISTLVIRVSVSGAEVSIDGKRVGKAPLAPENYVWPGRHEIEVTLAGYEPIRTTVDLAKGASREVSFPLRREVGKNTALLVTGGVLSVGALGAGAGLFIMSSSKLDETVPTRGEIVTDEGGCSVGIGNPHQEGCDKIYTVIKESDRLRDWGIASFVVGGVIGAATITYLVWPSSKPEERKGVRVTPVVTGTGGGFGVMGSF